MPERRRETAPSGPPCWLGLVGAQRLAAVARRGLGRPPTGDRGRRRVTGAADGAAVAPLALALGLVALAAWGVVLVLRGRARQVVVGGRGLAAAGVVWAVAVAFGRGQDDALAAVAAGGATRTPSTGADRLVLGHARWPPYCPRWRFAVAVRSAPGWPAMGSAVRRTCHPGPRRVAAGRPPSRTCGGRSTKGGTRPPEPARRDRPIMEPPPHRPRGAPAHGTPRQHPAAWTGVTIILIGFVVGGIGMVIDNWPMFWVGVALLPLGAIVGKIMQMMGMGAEPASDCSGRRRRRPSHDRAVPEIRSRWRGCGPVLLAAGLLRREPRCCTCATRTSRLLGACPWLLLTGTYCPGCGGLRAVNDLTHGDLVAAASSNLLLVGSLPLLRCWWVRRIVDSWRGVAPPPRRAARPTGWPGRLALTVAFSVVRNLPLGAWLAP